MSSEEDQRTLVPDFLEVGVQCDDAKAGGSRINRAKIGAALLLSTMILLMLVLHNTSWDFASERGVLNNRKRREAEIPDNNLLPLDDSFGLLDEPSEKEYFLVLDALRREERELYALHPQVHTPTGTDEVREESSDEYSLSKLSSLPWADQISANTLWEMSLHVPNKTVRSAYFDALHNGQNPSWIPRYIHATVFRAATTSPRVVEYVVGPVDSDSPSVTVYRTLPFKERPLGWIEYGALVDYLAIICRRLNPLLEKAYDASYFKSEPSALWTSPVEITNRDQTMGRTACHDPVSMKHPRGRPHCLIPSFASPLITYANTQARRVWFRLMRQVAPFIQYPVDIQFEIDHTSINPAEWSLTTVWFQGETYPTTEALMEAYENGSIQVINRPFVDLYPTQFQPAPGQRNIFEVGNVGDMAQTNAAVSPKLFMNVLSEVSEQKENKKTFSNSKRPDSRQMQSKKAHLQNNRISLQKRRVQYGPWDFHFTIRRETGLRVYDVRFAGKKLIADGGLDETVTAYWGSSPFMRHMTSLESMYGVGAMTSSLSPGIDCPQEAIYLPATMIPTAQQGPQILKQAICIFEWSMTPPGGPERRHFEFFEGNTQASGGTSSNVDHTGFASGVPSRVLVLRSISSLFNYDYVFDIVFYNSGVVEFAVSPTGYIHLDVIPPRPLLNRTSNTEQLHDWDTTQAYGFSSNKLPVYFVMHQHLFLYQLDLDVNGERNFVRTVYAHGQVNYNQGQSACQLPGLFNATACPALWMTFEDAKTEREAKYSMSFENPRQWLICESASESSDRANPRCVALINKGAIKTLLGEKHTRSFSWSRYQLVVTKRNESERYASSMFNGVNLVSPVVDFDTFSADDENILHEDIVLWITLGNVHIPRQEDMPNTGTSAGRLSFYIQPHNLFEYSPDAYSCDRVYTNSLGEWLGGFVETVDCRTEDISIL